MFSTLYLIFLAHPLNFFPTADTPQEVEVVEEEEEEEVDIIIIPNPDLEEEKE